MPIVRNATGCTAIQFDAIAAGLSPEHEPQPARPGRQSADPEQFRRPIGLARPAVNSHQTWWGFPTWRETLSPSWTDPTVQVNVGHRTSRDELPYRLPARRLVPLHGPARAIGSAVLEHRGQRNRSRACCRR